jgi:hypothetical protein
MFALVISLPWRRRHGAQDPLGMWLEPADGLIRCFKAKLTNFGRLPPNRNTGLDNNRTLSPQCIKLERKIWLGN